MIQAEFEHIMERDEILKEFTKIRKDLKVIQEQLKPKKKSIPKKKAAPDKTNFSVLKHQYNCQFGQDIMAYINLSMEDYSNNVQHEFHSPTFNFAGADWHVTLEWNTTDEQDGLHLDLYTHCSKDDVRALFFVTSKLLREGTYGEKADLDYKADGWTKREEDWNRGIRTPIFDLNRDNPLSNAKLVVSIQIEVYHEVQKEKAYKYKDQVVDPRIILEKLSGENSLYDAEILLKDSSSLKVHRSILAAHSPVFHAMFSGNFEDHKDGKVTINEFDCDVVRAFHKYLYSGKISQSTNFNQLIRLADKYKIPSLVEHCLEQLMLNITIDNCCELFLALKEFNLLRNRKQAAKVVKFISENQAAVQGQDKFKEIQQDNELLLLLFSWQDPVCRKRKFHEI